MPTEVTKFLYIIIFLVLISVGTFILLAASGQLEGIDISFLENLIGGLG